jgi:hypothetical protein
MAADDYRFEHANTRDEQVPQRDGSVARFKRVEFFLGKHGPFVERFTADEYANGGVQARVMNIRQQLLNMESL